VALSNDIDPRKYVLFGIGIDEKAKDIGSIIRINGSLTPKEMAGCYASSDLFINCTQEDNIPSVNIESISCGTPVVSYDVGGSKETIEEGVNGYIVPKNDEGAMLVAIENATKLKKTDSFTNSIKPYDKNVAGKAYLNLYKRLISKSKGTTIK
jgi:glycosyltransferase involved in cell wall biosynthesis